MCLCVCLECTKRIRIRFKSKLLWKQTINNKYEKKRAQQRKAETETETETERKKEREERTWTSYNIKRHVCGSKRGDMNGMASTDDNDDGRMREREREVSKQRETAREMHQVVSYTAECVVKRERARAKERASDELSLKCRVAVCGEF